MKKMTIDEMLGQLQALKNSGVSGSTELMIPTTGTNGHGVYLKRIETVSQSAVSKADFDRQASICKFVANRGVAVIAIH